MKIGFRLLITGVVVAGAVVAVMVARSNLVPTSDGLPTSSQSPIGASSCVEGGKFEDGKCVYPTPEPIKPSPTPSVTSKGTSKPSTKYFAFGLQTGDCFNRLKDYHNEKLVAIECSQPHQAQVIWAARDAAKAEGHFFTETPYYLAENWISFVGCGAAEFDMVVDESWNWATDDNIQVALAYPTKTTWKAGDRSSGCYLYVVKGKVTGSFLEPKP